MDTHCPFCGLEYGTAGESSHWCAASQSAKNAQRNIDQARENFMTLKLGKDAVAIMPMPSSELFNTEWTDVPICPYCGASHDQWWDGLDIAVEDGSEWNHECEHCGEEFSIRASVNIKFDTTPQPQNMPEMGAGQTDPTDPIGPPTDMGEKHGNQ